jgi:subtilisin-like proprotein convertase family protein
LAAAVLALASLAFGNPGAQARPLPLPTPGPLFPKFPATVASGLPAQCGFFAEDQENATRTPIPDKVGLLNGVITSTVNLTQSLPYIWEVSASTAISHTYPGDLEITLISPAGTRMTLSSRNGGGNDDVFANTIWTDSASIPVTDAVYSNHQIQHELVPEEAFGAFVGENGTGTWTLEVADEAISDTGTLNDWSIGVISLNRAPVVSTTSFVAVPVAPIPTTGSPLQLDIPVSTVATSLLDVNLITHIEQSRPGALDFSLAAPGDYSTTISTGNGGSHADWFDGTVWDDFAGKLYPPGPVTDDIHSSAVLTAAVPEGALGHFIGADPNGTWSLFIKDAGKVGGGVVQEWGLDITTGACTGALFLPLVSRN